MVTTSGNLFHIDFGHFLGNVKYFMVSYQQCHKNNAENQVRVASVCPHTLCDGRRDSLALLLNF